MHSESESVQRFFLRAVSATTGFCFYCAETFSALLSGLRKDNFQLNLVVVRTKRGKCCLKYLASFWLCHKQKLCLFGYEEQQVKNYTFSARLWVTGSTEGRVSPGFWG